MVLCLYVEFLQGVVCLYATSWQGFVCLYATFWYFMQTNDAAKFVWYQFKLLPTKKASFFKKQNQKLFKPGVSSLAEDSSGGGGLATMH